MNANIIHLLRRGDNAPAPISHSIITLLIVLLILLILSLLLVAALLFMRQRRRVQRQLSPPLYGGEKRLSTSSTSSHHRRVMVRPESVYVYQEKQGLMDSSMPPSPTSPIPEIRITFPEEFDVSGKRQSGRVVVVRVGDTSVGLEPAADEKLPAYGADERFQSLDLERIGGLVEKARSVHSKEWQ